MSAEDGEPIVCQDTAETADAFEALAATVANKVGVLQRHHHQTATDGGEYHPRGADIDDSSELQASVRVSDLEEGFGAADNAGSSIPAAKCCVGVIVGERAVRSALDGKPPTFLHLWCGRLSEQRHRDAISSACRGGKRRPERGRDDFTPASFITE
ncbi:hypothetical protein [Halobellus clavatus]|uniref:Uncharacterized protein n=1 Tax=Halobellus clavatus TaxID=660517 RepID=A0A1H3I9I3_9EURY|nr:hypothetical protein [Halobellus clavatus]SDY24340.1 hypothetical protein SAMN04487946_10975 [Halobellus clavatus]